MVQVLRAMLQPPRTEKIDHCFYRKCQFRLSYPVDFRFINVSGADILLGGLVSYDPSIKCEILKIDPALIQRSARRSQLKSLKLWRLMGMGFFRHADIIVSCTRFAQT